MMNVSGSSKALGQAGSNTKYIKIALFVTFAFLVSPSGMVETPRLQAKRGLAKWSRK